MIRQIKTRECVAGVAPFQKAMIEQGIPLASFEVEDVQKEYERMTKLGVVFRTKPTKTGSVTIALFDDTCGNLIQLYQV